MNNSNKDAVRIVTRKELCHYLRISHVTIQKMEKRGLPYLTVTGSKFSQRRYNLGEVMKWMEGNHE